MKKYLSILAVLATVLMSSCSNDDIDVKYKTTFRVNPATVISDYVEYNTGDLTSLGSRYKLRVRMLVYDESGALVASDESYSPDYTHIQTYNFDLSEGRYTTVAITDVVSQDDSVEFYTLSGENDIKTTKLEYTNLIGAQYSILGLTASTAEITYGSDTYNIDVKPAGALIVLHIANWNACEEWYGNGVPIDAEKYRLLGSHASSDLMLTQTGEPVYSVESSSSYDYIWYTQNRDKSYSGGYGYAFKFPMTSVKLTWQAVAPTGNWRFGDEAVINFEAGGEYFFELDVEDNESYWYNIELNSQRSGAGKMQKSTNAKEMLMKDLKLPLENEVNSISVSSYLPSK